MIGEDDQTYDVTFEMPDTAGTLYFIAHALVLGEDFYVADEMSIDVGELPTVVNVTGPDKVDGGKDASVTFTLEDVNDPDKVEVLWDTSSHGNGTGYPNSVVATDNGDGTWTVKFNVPDEDTGVYYRVHVEKDGSDVYSDESTFEVKKQEEDSPGFTLILMIVALAVIAVHVTSRRRH